MWTGLTAATIVSDAGDVVAEMIVPLTIVAGIGLGLALVTFVARMIKRAK